MNRIGMRAIKSALAIISAYLVYILLAYFDSAVFHERVLSKWFIPLIAALIGFFSVSNTKKDLTKNSLHILAVYLVVFLYAFMIMGLYKLIFQKPWPDITGLEPLDLLVPSFFICVGVLLLGYLMVLFNEKKRMLNGIVLYLIVVSLKFYNLTFWEFFASGIISIIYGVLVAYIFNAFPIHFRRYDRFVFIYGTDGVYNNSNDCFDYYVKYEMQELIRRGADITLFTSRTPSSLLPVIGDLKLNLPVICMSGATLYDTNNNHYLKTEGFDLETSNQIRDYLLAKEIDPFINIIRDNLLYIYKDKNNSIAELRFSDYKRNNSFSNFILDKAPSSEILFFTLVLKEEDMQRFIEELKKTELYQNLYLKLFDFDTIIEDLKGYKLLDIYSKKVESFKILDEFNQDKVKMAISTSMDDLVLLNKADRVITYKKAPESIKNKADYIIKSTRKHALIRVMRRFYYHKSSY